MPIKTCPSIKKKYQLSIFVFKQLYSSNILFYRSQLQRFFLRRSWPTTKRPLMLMSLVMTLNLVPLSLLTLRVARVGSSGSRDGRSTPEPHTIIISTANDRILGRRCSHRPDQPLMSCISLDQVTRTRVPADDRVVGFVRAEDKIFVV